MKALTNLHRDLHKLRLELAVATPTVTEPPGRSSTVFTHKSARPAETIRLDACRAINHFIQKDAFWIKSIAQKTLRTTSHHALSRDAVAKEFLAILEETDKLGVRLPERDSVGMHALILRVFDSFETWQTVQYVSMASRSALTREVVTEIYACLESSAIYRHFGTRDLISFCLALRRLSPHKDQHHSAISQGVLQRAHEILYTFSTNELPIFMRVGSELVPHSPLWREFITFYVAHHLEPSNEEEVMRMLLFVAQRIPMGREKSRALHAVVHRLLELARMPRIERMRKVKTAHVNTKGAYSFAAIQSVPTAFQVQGALDVSIALNSCKALHGMWKESVEFSRYVSEYLVPLCFGLATFGSDRANEKGVIYPKKDARPSRPQAEALCLLFADVLSESRHNEASQGQQLKRDQHVWWKRYSKEFFEQCVFPVLSRKGSAVQAVNAELYCFQNHVNSPV